MPPDDSHVEATSAAIFELVDEHARVEQVAATGLYAIRTLVGPRREPFMAAT